jgi:HNH endonuclease
MSDCILWDGYVNRDGYGEMSRGLASGQIKRPVHRLAYIGVHGPIDDDTHVHHKCGVKTCINVAHLELMTAADHCREHKPHLHITPEGRARIAAASRSRARIKQDTCGYGHDLTVEGARRASGECRLCHNRHNRAHKARARTRISE